MTRICMLAALLLLAAPIATPAERDMDAILEKIDQLFRSGSSRSTVEMKIVTPDWERTMRMEVWSEGTKKTFIRITEPRKERGMGTLRIDKEMWNYLPKVGKVIKVPPSMMTASWMGSDFSNDDLVSQISFIDDYDHAFTEVEGARDLICIESIPHEGVPVVWSRLVTAVTSDEYLPVWERSYDERGKLIRTMEFTEPKMFGSRKLPSVMTIIPENEDGNRTVMRYEEAVFDIELDENIFSMRNLRSP
jgi:hypothetical protein